MKSDLTGPLQSSLLSVDFLSLRITRVSTFSGNVPKSKVNKEKATLMYGLQVCSNRIDIFDFNFLSSLEFSKKSTALLRKLVSQNDYQYIHHWVLNN